MTEPIKRRPRWLRFSLRSLLVVMTVLCVWLGIQVNAARRQKQAVAAILKAGGSVGYTYELRPDEGPIFGMFNCDRNAPIPGPAWLRKLIGDDYSRTAFQVKLSLDDEDAARAAINAMASLPTIRGVSLNARTPRDCKIQDSDLVPLGQLNKLERLSLRDTPQVSGAFLSQLSNPAGMIELSLTWNDIDDAAMAHIGRMTILENLHLVNNKRITDAGLAHLRKLARLKELTLDGLGITDAGLKHLAGLNRLTYVLVEYSAVTANGIRELQRALPNCNISRP